MFICSFPQKGPASRRPRGETPPALRQGAPVRRPRTPGYRCEEPARVSPSRPGVEARPLGADSPARAPGQLQGGPLPAPRASRAPRPSTALTEKRSRSVAAMASSAPGGRAGASTRGRDGDKPAAGRAPPGRLQLNGSNMATSWKLPLAAAAGEAAEPPPPPPAGPASPSGPATSAAPAPPLGLPGVSVARREVPAAGAAGTCSLRVGGPGRAVPGGPVPAGLPRVPGRLGPRPGASVAARALGSRFRGEESGVLRAPQGSPLPSRLHHAGACKCTANASQSVDGLTAARRVQERPPQPRKAGALGPT